MREIKAIIRQQRIADVLKALQAIPDLPGATVSVVKGFGRRVDLTSHDSGFGETEMAKLDWSCLRRW